jgi:hypothetical protein
MIAQISPDALTRNRRTNELRIDLGDEVMVDGQVYGLIHAHYLSCVIEGNIIPADEYQQLAGRRAAEQVDEEVFDDDFE